MNVRTMTNTNSPTRMEGREATELTRLEETAIIMLRIRAEREIAKNTVAAVTLPQALIAIDKLLAGIAWLRQWQQHVCEIIADEGEDLDVLYERLSVFTARQWPLKENM